MSNSDFVTFPCGILGQVWYLIVLIPDLCRLSYFDSFCDDALDKLGSLYVTQQYLGDDLASELLLSHLNLNAISGFVPDACQRLGSP